MQLGIKAHAETNHLYDKDYPYALHLAHVVDVAYRFGYQVGLSKEEMVIAVSACWLHDSIEDARLTYNDVNKVTGQWIAEIVRAVTNYGRGRNRAERMPDFVYDDIKKVPLAAFVKFCDRIANMEYSYQKGSGMFKKYVFELPDFVEKLYDDKFKPMLEYLTEMSNKYESDLTLK